MTGPAVQPESSTFVRSSQTSRLEAVPPATDGTWASARLNVRIQITGEELVIFRPDGERFKTVTERMTERDTERIRADHAEARAQQLAARLRELGVDPASINGS